MKEHNRLRVKEIPLQYSRVILGIVIADFFERLWDWMTKKKGT